MKNIFRVIVSLEFFSFSGVSQIIENIDEIAPFQDELSVIRKGNQWVLSIMKQRKLLMVEMILF